MIVHDLAKRLGITTMTLYMCVNGDGSVKRWIGIVLVIVALAGSAAVQAGEIVNENTYGNCRVLTDIDALTDKVTHKLACGTGAIAITLVWSDKAASVHFTAKAIFHPEPLVDVAWWIDPRRFPMVRMKNAFCSSDMNVAEIPDRRIFDDFLDKLPAGTAIHIEVGIKFAIISLDGSAAAVQDFRARISR